jgi:hypothetical protein
VPLLRLGAWHESLDRAEPGGSALPAISLAPEILVRRDARTLNSRGSAAAPDPAARAEILAEAVRLFGHGTVHCGGLGDQDAAEFQAALWSGAGLPPTLVRRWCAMLEDGLARLLAGPPPPARAGTTLVSLPGNTFTCLESVLEAAWSGGAVWVRPSTREPLSALRLVSALLQAGWPGEALGFYPCARPVLAALVAVTDRQIVYGGAEIRELLSVVPSAVVHGPVRACALVPAEADAAFAAHALLPLVAGDSGRFCTAVRTVLCLGDADALARELGALLDAIAPPPGLAHLPLAAEPDPRRAAALCRAVERLAGPYARRATTRPLLGRAGDHHYLAPALFRLADTGSSTPSWGDPPLLGFEAPFPLATVIQMSEVGAAALAAGADRVHRLDFGAVAAAA